MSNRSTYGKIITLAITLVVIVTPVSGLCGSDGIRALELFIKTSDSLHSLLGNIHITSPSSNRGEVYAEEDGVIYAVVSYRSKNYRGSLMLKLCSSALLHSQTKLFTNKVKKSRLNDELLNEVVIISTSKAVIKGIKTIGKKSKLPWHFHACKVNVEDIKFPDYPQHKKYYIASARYSLAKKKIHQRKFNEAIKLLQGTTHIPDIHQSL